MTREEIIEELFCDSQEMREHLLKPENCNISREGVFMAGAI